MKSTIVAIIDTGISRTSECQKNIIQSFILKNEEGSFPTVIVGDPIDYIGHGTAVATIIYNTNPNIDIICFRICDDIMSVDESGLISVLEYIYDNIEVDIINISLGAIYQFMHSDLREVCRKLHQKGIVIVSSFDNNGAVSYPAAFDEVIGVDTKNKYENKDDIYMAKSGIVDIFVPNIYYRTMWNEQKTILRGSSFATAKIVGLLSLKIKELTTPFNKNALLELIANKQINIENYDTMQSPHFQIKKAIIFPVNKEVHALLRFKEMLNFQIFGVFDERLSGNVGKTMFSEKIGSFDSINWNDDFDTIILSCTKDLTALTKRQYVTNILEKAQIYNKSIYSFEPIKTEYKRMYYPGITTKMVPHGNNFKLHKPTIPVVGIFGTSSKQGKFSLQLDLKNRLTGHGYDVGHISTEPSGYLFDSDFVFHFGYQSDLNIQSWECISILNNMVWETQLKGKDILITGCQSGTLHYDNSNVENFAIIQYAFLLGIMPDFCVLCINPHDDIEYITRTIGFINSIDNGKVRAIALFPIQAIETITGINYKMQKLSEQDLKNIKIDYEKIFNLPIYTIGDELDMNNLTDLIVSYFSVD